MKREPESGRNYATVIAAGVLAGAFLFPAPMSAKSYKLEASRAVSRAGAEASIDVRFSADQVEVGAIAFFLAYDPTRIQLSQAQSPSGTTENVVLKPRNNALATSVTQSLGGRLGIVVFDASPPVGAIPSGTTVNVRFRVLPGADGFIPIRIEDVPDASDPTGRILDTSIAILSHGGVFVSPTRASLRAAPSQIDLGELPPGRSFTRSVTLVNDGNIELQLKDITLTGSNAFRITSDIRATKLEPGTATSVEVEFAGGEPSSQNALITAEAEVGDTTIPLLQIPIRASVVPPDVSLLQYRRLIPAVARTAGASGSFWVSELSIHNPTESRQTVMLSLLPESTSSLTLRLNPWETKFFSDVLATPELRRESFAGALVLHSSSAEIIVRSSTVNLRPEGGRLGQTVPALEWKELFHGRETATLTAIRNDPGARTNVTLMNAGEVALTLTLTARNASGANIGATSYVVGPGEIRNTSDLLARLNAGIEPFTLSIRCDNDSGIYYAYASEIDNRTGAPVFQSAR